MFLVKFLPEKRPEEILLPVVSLGNGGQYFSHINRIYIIEYPAELEAMLKD
jgi:hypothetical protein